MSPQHLALTVLLIGIVGSFPSSAKATPSDLIVVDQFGYNTDARKLAMVRRPIQGFDKNPTLLPPHARLVVVNDDGSKAVFEGGITPWQSGATDDVSGDKVFWFDFSPLKTPGRYYIRDPQNGTRSPSFLISASPYKDVLTAATKTFFYQRAGYEKSAKFAGKSWADGASHVGPGQDKEARRFNAKDDASTAKDLHGGWYDAGDYNKYTSWTAGYIIQLLRAFTDNEEAFTDKTSIPESGNGLPDIIDEIRFGLDWLLRMQEPSGALLSVMGLSHASPPSKATGASYYGPPNTIATITSAATFAYASFVLSQHPAWGLDAYQKTLKTAAIRAYSWAVKNPKVLFKNNDAEYNSGGLAAGQQEADDYGRSMGRLKAAYYLWRLTGEENYHRDFLARARSAHLIEWYTPTPYEVDINEVLAEYQSLAQANPELKTLIQKTYSAGLQSDEFVGAFTNQRDAYNSFMKSNAYHWGSNSVKMNQGLGFAIAAKYGIEQTPRHKLLGYAQEFLHYIHGRNPLGLVYLTNMESLGASKSLTSIYHSWFSADSAMWSKKTALAPGPAPGFLSGGPNKNFKVDQCCPARCKSAPALRACQLTMSPPLGQPPAKSYLDYNANWPLNSWEISENSNGYQVTYIRLLSYFVKQSQP